MTKARLSGKAYKQMAQFREPLSNAVLLENVTIEIVANAPHLPRTHTNRGTTCWKLRYGIQTIDNPTKNGRGFKNTLTGAEQGA